MATKLSERKMTKAIFVMLVGQMYFALNAPDPVGAAISCTTVVALGLFYMFGQGYEILVSSYNQQVDVIAALELDNERLQREAAMSRDLSINLTNDLGEAYAQIFLWQDRAKELLEEKGIKLPFGCDITMILPEDFDLLKEAK